MQPGRLYTRQSGLLIAMMLLACLELLQIRCSAPSTVAAEQLRTEQSDYPEQNKWKALFQWRRYFQHFAKKYSSPLEAMSRRAYQLANALRVYRTGVAYKKRLSSHYLALNHMSDRSPKELERMLNAVMASDDSPGRSEAAFAGPAGVAKVETGRELEVNSAPDGDQRRYKLARRKRDTETRQTSERELTLDMLIQDTGPVPESAEVLAKMATEPESNNPAYDPEAAAALPLKGSLSEQLEKLNAWMLSVQTSDAQSEAPNTRPKSMLDQVRDFLGGVGQNLITFKQNASNGLPDEMFVDLRQTGCMFKPRDQGVKCGACYAFAGVTMAEFLFCREMGKLYEFSEQYLIDCGKGRVGEMNGCWGALDRDLPAFVHNFGLELRQRYPYAGDELQCPYPDGVDLKSTGYIRMDLNDYLFVPVPAWPQVLKTSPIFAGLAAPEHFLQYGGGVDSGQKCASKSNHAVLVVGHGREDGQEFWLIRNSFGVHWGQGGYYKLAKSAPERCINKQIGLVWGTRNAQDFGIRTTLNGMNLQVKHKPEPDLNKLFA